MFIGLETVSITTGRSLEIPFHSCNKFYGDENRKPSVAPCFIIYHWCSSRQAAHLPGSSEVAPIYHCRFREKHLRLRVIAGKVGEPPHQGRPKHIRQLLPVDAPLSLQQNLW